MDESEVISRQPWEVGGKPWVGGEAPTLSASLPGAGLALSPSAAGVSSVPSTRAGKLRAGESSHRFTATERVGRLVESFA